MPKQSQRLKNKQLSKGLTMADVKEKICPLMNRSIPTVGAYDQPTIETNWVACEKENCQLWSQVYTIEGIPTSGCALEIAAHKTQDGKYAV
jgi:hypothetical protein